MRTVLQKLVDVIIQERILRNAAHDNIAQIIEIESKYLSALEDEARALSMISEEEYSGGGDD